MLTLVATKVADQRDQPRWLDGLRALNETTGATLWRTLEEPAPGRPGPGFTHVLRFDSDDALEIHDARVVQARRSGTLPIGHAEIRRDRWTLHRGDPAPGAIAGLIAAEVLCTDPARHEEWDAWYDDQHLPDMMASGAFATGTRWRRADPQPGGANDLTLYETVMDVREAIEQSAAIMPALIAAGRKHECHTGGLTLALVRVE